MISINGNQTQRSKLIRDAQKGDHKSFETLIQSYHQYAKSLAFTHLKSTHYCEDVVQDAFIHAFTHLHQLNEVNAFSVWFARIVFKFSDRYNRQAFSDHSSIDVDVDENVDDKDSGLDSDSSIEKPRTLSDSIQHHQNASYLRHSIAALPEHQRIVTVLFYLVEKDQKSIAEFLDLPIGTVKKRLHAARANLQEEFTQMLKSQLNDLKQTNEEQLLCDRVAFSMAVRNGDCELTQSLLNDSPELVDLEESWDWQALGLSNLPLPTKATPLIRAAGQGDLKMVKLLLNNSAKIERNCGCGTNESALWAAVANNSIDICTLLLEQGANPNKAIVSGSSPLHVAVIKQNIDLIKLLIKFNADPHIKNLHGTSAVEWAKKKNNLAILRLLDSPNIPAEDWVAENAIQNKVNYFHSGIKAIDLFCTLPREGIVQVSGKPGVGRSVLIAEVCYKIAKQGGRSVWVHWPTEKWQSKELQHLISETNNEDAISLIASDTYSAETEKDLVANIDGLFERYQPDQHKQIPLALVLFRNVDNKNEIDFLLGKYGGRKNLMTFVLEANAETEVKLIKQPPYDCGIDFDAKLASQYIFPAIDIINSYSSENKDSVLPEALNKIKEAAIRICHDDERKAESLNRYLSQAFECTEAFTGVPGEDVSINSLIGELNELLAEKV